MISLRKVQCLLTVAEDCLFSEPWCVPSLDLHDNFPVILETKELDAQLCRIKSYMKRKCEDCCNYYEQEPSLTTLIQRIAGMHRYDYFECVDLLSCPFYSEFLTLCVSILKASRELPSSLPLELRHCVVPSPNGKLIAVRDTPFLALEGHTIKVFMNLTETDETVSFPDPVHVIEEVTASAFTCNSDFVVYVQKEGRCFQALSLHTGSILSCDSGFSPSFQVMPSELVDWVCFLCGK